VSSTVADPLAVYRAPWHTPLNFDGPGTEVDLIEAVFPVRTSGPEWTVFREACTVDVLLHHRDSRPVAPGLGDSAFAVLLWRFAATTAELLATPATGLVNYLSTVRAAGAGAAAPAPPAGWRVATESAAGPAMHTLSSVLDARLPRAVPIDLNFAAAGGPANGQRVLLLALVASTLDDPIVAPAGPPATVADLVQAWPPAAMRIVRVINRV
jgi:hypothetical protein